MLLVLEEHLLLLHSLLLQLACVSKHLISLMLMCLSLKILFWTPEALLSGTILSAMRYSLARSAVADLVAPATAQLVVALHQDYLFWLRIDSFSMLSRCLGSSRCRIRGSGTWAARPRRSRGTPRARCGSRRRCRAGTTHRP